jgi:hypothetical protein
MSKADRKAWRENKRANHRRNEERRWDRKLWVPNVLNQVLLPLRRQAVDGCIPRQMMTGPETGNSYAQAVASENASYFRHVWDGSGSKLSSATLQGDL